MPKPQMQFINAKVKKSGDRIEVIASDETVDRHGDSIPVSSWDLTNFLTAPRMLVDHDYRTEKIVGVWQNPRTENGQLIVEPLFHSITELAKETQQMVDEGFLNTVSVGFIPHFKKQKDENGDETTVAHNELLEVSWAAVPANASARIKKLIDGDEESQKEAVETFVVEFLKSKDIEEKGEVADELSKEAIMEQKYANLRSIFDIVYAMADVYMRDDTPVENFSTLASECADLIKQVAGGAEINQESVSVDGEFALKMAGVEVEEIEQKDIDAMQTKEGRVLSKKNRELISKTIGTLKDASTVLQELYDATDAPNEDGGKGVSDTDVSEKNEDTIVLDRSVLLALRNQMRVNDKSAEAGIVLINGLLKPVA